MRRIDTLLLGRKCSIKGYLSSRRFVGHIPNLPSGAWFNGKIDRTVGGYEMMLLRAFLMMVFSAGYIHAEDKPVCGDFLAQLHEKPKYLEFLGCKPDLNNQETKPLVARYRVKGIYAAAVERFLQNSFSMAQIKRTCCLWGSGERDFKWKDGRIYYLSMGSEETLVDKRSDWRKIQYFYVEFSLQTEEP